MAEVTSISFCTMSNRLQGKCPPFRQVFRRGKSEEAVCAFSEEASMEVAAASPMEGRWRVSHQQPAPPSPPSTKTTIPAGSWGEGRVSKFKQDSWKQKVYLWGGTRLASLFIGWFTNHHFVVVRVYYTPVN